MLTFTREKEKTPVLKRPRGRPRKHFIKKVDLKSEDEAIKVLFIILDVDLKQSVSYKTRSRR